MQVLVNIYCGALSTYLLLLKACTHSLTIAKRKRLLSQGLKLINIAADNVQASMPEICRANIDAKACRQGCGISLTRRREQVIIAGFERFGILQITRVKTKPEEQAEHVGVIVERKLAA